MGNMLYNGVELPDINEVWTDKVTYPYACILFYDNTIYCLFLSTDKLCRLGSSLVGCKDGAIKGIQYQMEDGSWSFLMNRDFGATSGAAYAPAIWSSYDFNYSDGSLILAATDPVDPNAPTEPVWQFNLQDFLSGIAAGAASRGVMKRKPIAYLYNGVQLPPLPEVEGYEYMTIQPVDDNYVLRAYKEKPSAYEGSVAIFYGIPSSVETECLTGNLNVDKTGWSYTTWTTGTSSLMYYKEESILNTLKPIFWTNTDIYDLDGSLWLSASEPVPVYGGGN